jgi:hypothetical protein
LPSIWRPRTRRPCPSTAPATSSAAPERRAEDQLADERQSDLRRTWQEHISPVTIGDDDFEDFYEDASRLDAAVSALGIRRVWMADCAPRTAEGGPARLRACCEVFGRPQRPHGARRRRAHRGPPTAATTFELLRAWSTCSPSRTGPPTSTQRSDSRRRQALPPMTSCRTSSATRSALSALPDVRVAEPPGGALPRGDSRNEPRPSAARARWGAEPARRGRWWRPLARCGPSSTRYHGQSRLHRCSRCATRLARSCISRRPVCPDWGTCCSGQTTGERQRPARAPFVDAGARASRRLTLGGGARGSRDERTKQCAVVDSAHHDGYGRCRTSSLCEGLQADLARSTLQLAVFCLVTCTSNVAERVRLGIRDEAVRPIWESFAGFARQE